MPQSRKHHGRWLCVIVITVAVLFGGVVWAFDDEHVIEALIRNPPASDVPTMII
jgi:hypothetical protein